MPDIQHVVVLMLENRSFDCMLGPLYPDDPDYRGLTLKENNVHAGKTYPVWNDSGMSPQMASILTPDPGELFTDINQQLIGEAGRSKNVPPMSGFAENYAGQKSSPGATPQAGDVLHYFTPAQVPIISELVRSFGVCDEWFAGAPCRHGPTGFLPTLERP